MTTPAPFPRIGGPSSVFPGIRVRYANGKYHAAAAWSDYRARASRNGYNVESEGLTSSQAAVECAWLAHVRLSERVCAPRDDSDDGDREFWSRQLAGKVDRDAFVAFVVDGDGVSGGGYVVSFLSVESAHVIPPEVTQ
jgi:hypothetical protein